MHSTRESMLLDRRRKSNLQEGRYKVCSYLIHEDPVAVFGGQVCLYGLWMEKRESEVMSPD